MPTTYKDIYNAEARAMLSYLSNWHVETATRPERDEELIDGVVDATQDMFREWARTHSTRPAGWAAQRAALAD